MEVSGQLHTVGTVYPGKKPPVTHWIGGWVGPRASLDIVEKNLLPLHGIVPWVSSRYPIALLIELSQLL
jgi:hypothetical protein